MLSKYLKLNEPAKIFILSVAGFVLYFPIYLIIAFVTAGVVQCLSTDPSCGAPEAFYISPILHMMLVAFLLKRSRAKDWPKMVFFVAAATLLLYPSLFFPETERLPFLGLLYLILFNAGYYFYRLITKIKISINKVAEPIRLFCAALVSWYLIGGFFILVGAFRVFFFPCPKGTWFCGVGEAVLFAPVLHVAVLGFVLYKIKIRRWIAIFITATIVNIPMYIFSLYTPKTIKFLHPLSLVIEKYKELTSKNIGDLQLFILMSFVFAGLYLLVYYIIQALPSKKPQ